jgi:hypothetical protein
MIKLSGNLLIDVYRITNVGESFKHCWKSGATINFSGKKLYFANEARTFLLIYVSDNEEMPNGISISTIMMPERAEWVGFESQSDSVVITFGEKGHLTRNTFRQQKYIIDKVQAAFDKYFEFAEDKIFTIDTEVLDALSKDIDVTTLRIEGGKFSMIQQSPDAEVKTERIWDLESATRGTMLKFMRRKIPANVVAEVMVGTDELCALKMLSNSVDLCINGREKPLCGRATMLNGEAIFMLYPFVFKRGDESANAKA